MCTTEARLRFVPLRVAWAWRSCQPLGCGCVSVVHIVLGCSMARAPSLLLIFWSSSKDAPTKGVHDHVTRQPEGSATESASWQADQEPAAEEDDPSTTKAVTMRNVLTGLALLALVLVLVIVVRVLVKG